MQFYDNLLGHDLADIFNSRGHRCKEIEEINERITGEASEHEHIIVKVQNLTWKNIDATNDSKLLVAASKFDRSFPGIIKKN